MLEYVKRLLRMQQELAARFEPAPQPELPPEAALERKRRQLPEDAAAHEAGQEAEIARDEAQEAGERPGQTAQEQLAGVQRAAAQITRMQMQQALRRAQTQAAQQQRQIRQVQQRQTVDLAKKTPQSMRTAPGGIQASRSRTMETAGVVSAAAQWSMQEISRFFERDARRYG